jgi:transposase
VRDNDGRKLDHKTLEEIRRRAVERVQAGESPEVVIKALGFCRACIYNWLAMYRAGGWSALKARALSGRPRKISAAQMRWIYQTVVGKSPLQYLFEFALWTREMIQVLLKQEFHLNLSVSSVGRLLRQLGLSCQRPLFRAYEQNPLRVEQWLREEYPTIRALAKKTGAEIYFGDEAGVRSDYHSGTTWGVIGQTPVVSATGRRFSMNMISAVSAQGRLRFMVVEGKVDGPQYVAFLKRLLHHAPRPIFLILDGHPVHKARLVKQYVASTNGMLRLFCLPPYSPELNPDEQVWNHVKNHGIGRALLRSKADLRLRIQSLLRRLQKMPGTIRTFFLLPDTQYAANQATP